MNITVADVVKKFDLKVITNEQYLSNKIFVKELNIASLELVGFYVNPKQQQNLVKRAIVFGKKEFLYLKIMKKDIKIENYNNIFKKYDIPAVFIVDSFNDPDLVKVLADYKIPLIKVENINKYEFIGLYLEYLSIYLSKNVIFHGSFISVYGYGTLIIGNSGIGKSEVVLELVKKKHLFVGDDSIVLTRRNNRIIGHANETIKNYLEVRGIGIIDLTKLYGSQIILDESYLDIVIELVEGNWKNLNINRLGKSYGTIQIHNVSIPKLEIPVTPGRNVSEIIETAVAKYKSDVILGSTFDEFEIKQKKILTTKRENND